MTSPFPFLSGSVLQAQQLNDITNLPINDQTASYTLVVGDAGKRVVMNVATANTVTVDDSVFTTGDTIFVANKDAATTITAGAGVTINSASGLVLIQHQSGTLIALSASSFLFVASDVSVASITTATATVATDQTTNSTTFTDMATVGPEVTLTTGTKVLVFTSAFIVSPASRFGSYDFTISGATTRAAEFTTAGRNGINDFFAFNRSTTVNLLTVTAGSNTFTMKYSNSAAVNCNFSNRTILVVAL